MNLVIGQEYRRKELHDQFGGSRQGGISPSRVTPVVFLITSPSGHQHGYQYDGPQPDGTYWYTGEGQVGDMRMISGNKAIRDAEKDGREIHLFEESRTAFLRYVGRAAYAGHHFAPAPDRNKNLRQAIVFELTLEDADAPSVPAKGPPKTVAAPSDVKLWNLPLDALREFALTTAAKGATPDVHRRTAYARSAAVRIYVLRRAKGVCEACLQPAPFATARGEPYLEPHHTRRLADGGPDHPRWVAAVCPNCHTRVHYGADGAQYNETIAAYIGTIEA